MAINLADKYSTKVVERFSSGSRTDKYAGHDYDFTGVKTIKVYSVDTVPLVDYTRSGTSRFGELTELGDTVQEMTLTQDKGFTFSIDAGNASEQFNIKHANACLKREIDEVITPHIDKYRLGVWAQAGMRTPIEAEDLTKDNIVEKIFLFNALLSDKNVPLTGRTLFIPELTYVQFKLADVVMAADGIGGENLRRGYKGTIDGLDVVTVPGSIWADSEALFLIKHNSATVDPVKLKNYRVHKNPMGVDGDVVEGRVIFDSFVLNTKQDGIIVAVPG